MRARHGARGFRGGAPACAALAALAVLLAPDAARAARLELRGWPAVSREGEALMAPALRAPGDSTQLAAALGASAGRLQGEGWLDARVSAAWAKGADPVLRVDVSPGERWRWGAFSLDVPREDSLAVAVSIGWREDVPVDPAWLTAAVQRAVTDAEAAGYAWAHLGVSAWDRDSGRVRVRVSGARGPRVIVTDVRLEGLQVTQPERALRAMGRLRGLPYNPAASRLATQRLEELGVFRRVEYLGLAGGADWHQGVLRWRVEEPRENTFEGAVGVQGAGGAVGLAKLDLGNLMGSARSVSLAWQSRGRGLSDFGARFVEPLAFGSPIRLEAALQQQVQDSSYTRFTFGGRAIASIGARERVEVDFDEERVSQSIGDVTSANLENTTFALERDDRDDALSPRRGTWLRFSGTQVFKREFLRPLPGAPPDSRPARANAGEIQGEWHRRLSGSTGLTFAAHAAGRFSSDRVMADYERYPLGGAASLRGHDEDAYHVDRYVLTTVEYRFFPGLAGQRLALFWDHAEMATRVALPAGGDEQQRARADGVGFGMRIPAASGAVNLDYAIEPGRSFLEGKIHLRLVTAF